MHSRYPNYNLPPCHIFIMAASENSERAAASEHETPPSDPEELPYKTMPYTAAVTGGHEIQTYSKWGGKVMEHRSSAGAIVALKVRPKKFFHQSEANLMHYAATHAVKAPRVLGVYDIETKPQARVMVSDRVPGRPLVELWQTATAVERASYKEQLREQIARMRECTQPFIGRLDDSGERICTQNVFDTLCMTELGPFNDDEEFEEWVLARAIRPLRRPNPISRYKWRKFVQRELRNSSGRYVLTHCDLAPRNIMAQDGVITGIIDWGRSGFFPEYAEYAIAMELSPSIEEWWIPVLKEILQPCSKDRLKFTRLASGAGW